MAADGGAIRQATDVVISVAGDLEVMGAGRDVDMAGLDEPRHATASDTVIGHSRLSRSANPVVNRGGMCWVMSVGGTVRRAAPSATP